MGVRITKLDRENKNRGGKEKMKLVTKVLIFLWQEIEKLIFPPCCLICSKLSKEIWCKNCKKELYQKAIFKVENKEKCYFEKHVYLFLYKDKIRDLILDYKFNDKSYLYKIFAEIIIKNKKICGILEKYDIMVSVPIHKKRKKQRGYNQSELIAKEVANQIEKLEYQANVLKKVIHTLPQSSLSKIQRKQNVQNVYKIINKEKIKNKKIILFDDIYTTGSTANACAKILKENGAKEILVLTIAKD